MSRNEWKTATPLRWSCGRCWKVPPGYREDVAEGRWVIEAKHRMVSWEVIVEPDEEEKLLVVITAYPVDR